MDERRYSAHGPSELTQSNKDNGGNTELGKSMGISIEKQKHMVNNPKLWN